MKKVETVIINWKRPANVGRIVEALRKQTAECTVTVCDCHLDERFTLPRSVFDNADRVYRWTHNTGPYSRYVPLAAYDHEYTFFIDDDMVPGRRCVEHFVQMADDLSDFGSIGQMGRIIPADGVYRPRDIPRLPHAREVDVLVRGFFVRTRHLHHVAQLRWMMNYVDEQVPEDDMLLCVAMRMCAGLRNYLTPADPDPETLMNQTELPDPHALHRRPDHLKRRVEFMRCARALGWTPAVREPTAAKVPSQRQPKGSGVLYLGLGATHAELVASSARSLRLHGYSGPIRVVTDQGVEDFGPLDCEVRLVGRMPAGFPSRFHKTQLHRWAFDRTLFLDADTVIISPIDKIWEMLAGHDLAMTPDLHGHVAHVLTNSINDPRRRAPEYQLMRDLGLTGRRYYNSGVMLFERSPKIEDMFNRWHQEWNRFRGEDQLALVRAIAGSGVKVKTLDSAWNRRPKAFTSVHEARVAGVKILHFLSRQRSFLNDTYLSEVAEYLG